MAPLNGDCNILEFNDSDLEYFHDDNVLALSPPEARRLLAGYVDDIEHNELAVRDTLERLATIKPKTAFNFTLKSTNLPRLKFRLISTIKQAAENLTSFIALSYSCGVEAAQGISLHDGQSQNDFRLPVSRLMSRALVRELQSRSEGIWCDQLCSSQTDISGMAVSIGLMDGVYRAARLVVVVLDDFELVQKSRLC